MIAIVQKLKKTKSFSTNNSIDDRLNDYFLICELTGELEIVLLDKILNKCVLIVRKDEYFLSVCDNLNEHD